LRSYAGDLESLVQDLRAHLGVIRERLAAALPSEVQTRVTAVADTAVVVEAVSARLEQLGKVARRLTDRGPLAVARRLGARLSRLRIAGTASDGDLRLLSRETDKALAEAERLLEVEDRGPGTVTGSFGAAGDQGGGVSDESQAGDCTAATVLAASGRFDTAVRGFRGALLRAMLPPEVDNLQRVVHMLEATRSSLLRELTGHSVGRAAMGEPLVAGCQRYFAGVGQLEADLGHYRGLLAQLPRKTKGKRGRRRKGHRQLPNGRARRPASIAGGGGERSALNARSFG